MSQQTKTTQVQLSFPPSPIGVSIQLAKLSAEAKQSLAAIAREKRWPLTGGAA